MAASALDRALDAIRASVRAPSAPRPGPDHWRRLRSERIERRELGWDALDAAFDAESDSDGRARVQAEHLGDLCDWRRPVADIIAEARDFVAAMERTARLRRDAWERDTARARIEADLHAAPHATPAGEVEAARADLRRGRVMAFAFEHPSLHDVDHVTAWGHASSYRGDQGALTITAVNAAGETVDVGLSFGPGTARYVRDLAEAMNRVADEHGRLSEAERLTLGDQQEAV